MAGEHASAIVLVVEDARVNRLALARGVEHEGHRVLEAADGREALDILARERVDMMLLDLIMPELDGFAVLEQVGRDPELRDIPVLVISAVEETEDIARAIEMGAIDCLSKPFEPVLLRVRLRTALEQARLRRIEQDYLKQELALRQQERLATLGKLSAGLGHELNNPAAAALGTARQLQQSLAESERILSRLVMHPQGSRVCSVADALLEGAAPPATTVERHELAEAIEAVVVRAGLTGSSGIAADLAGIGVDPEAVAAGIADVSEDAELTLDWLRVRAGIRRSVAQIVSSVERMASLTSALRGYSYLDQAPRQSVDVRDGLDDTLTILAHKIADAVSVLRDDAPDVPIIDAYGSQLNQVWTNLIDNAIQAVGRAGTVAVRARPNGDGVLVEVEDDGPGIPADLLGRVFDPFVTTKPPGQGTGLGLSISYQIVTDVHGGKLSVVSRPGHTVFRVELPAAAPDGNNDGD